MVKVCSYNYPKSDDEGYEKYHEMYEYPLHDFQKWAIKSIVSLFVNPRVVSIFSIKKGITNSPIPIKFEDMQLQSAVFRSS